MKNLSGNHCGSQSGSVFIVVLVVCLGLVSMTLVFGHSMMMAYRGAETDIAGKQAEKAIEGAVQYAEYLIASGTAGYLPASTTYQSEAVPVGDASFWFIGEPSSSDSATVPTFALLDEASKINLNTASATMLQNLPNMTPELAQAIVTWRNANATQNSASASKGGPFESVQEMALLTSQAGDDLSILVGDDTNLNHVLDASENQGGGQFNPGIFEYVTVFSREPNTLGDGTKRINVTKPSAALNQLLTKLFGKERFAKISAGIGGRQIHSVLELYVRGGLTMDEMDKLTPKATMSDGAFAKGLINANTASLTVLECVPGIDAGKAAQIVSARANQAQPYTNLAWLVPILSPAGAIQAGPYLTTFSYQARADVAAVGRNGRGFRRSLFVIDSSTGAPEVVYRHNLASLGWALGPDALQSLGKQRTVQ